MDPSTFEKLSFILEDNLEDNYPDLCKVYNNLSNTSAGAQHLLLYCGEWITQCKNLDGINFNDSIRPAILFILQKYISENTVTDSLAKVKYQKNYTRKYLYDLIRAEMGDLKCGPRNPQYIHTECEMYFQLKSFNTIESVFSSKEEFINARYQIVKDWFSNSNSLIIEFPYYTCIPDKAKINDFFMDLAHTILSIIQNEYYNNLESGFLTKIPDKLASSPFFSASSSNLDLKYEIQDGYVKTFDSYQKLLSNVNQEFQLETIIGDFPLENADISDLEKYALFETLKKDYEWENTSKTLDMKDMNLLSIIYSSMNADILTQDKMVISLKSIAQVLFQKPAKSIRTREYQQLIDHLEKLANYKLKYQKKDAKGNIVEKAIISFMDIHYVIPESIKNSTTTENTMILTSGTFRPYDVELANRNVAGTVLQIMPSFFLKDSYRNRTNNAIYTQIYRSIEDITARAFLFILQQERLKSRPEFVSTIYYSYFIERVRFDSRKSRTKKLISEKLSYLQEHNALIESFELFPNYITIKWLPLSKIELMIYNIENDLSVKQIEP